MGDERWQSYIDKIIEEARERGEFDLDHLKGKRLSDSQLDDFAGDRAMANKVLKNSGHAPPFLMRKRDIDARIEKLRDLLLRYALRRRRLNAEAGAVEDAAQAEALRDYAEKEWQWAVRQVEEALPELNKEIDLYNLINPIPSMFRRKVRLERELEWVAGRLEER